MIAALAEPAPGVCPSWCQEDLSTSPGEVLHCHDLPQAWGGTPEGGDERLRLGLARQDNEDGPAEPRICVQYLPRGHVVDGTVDLDLDEGPDFALAILRLAADARGISTSDLLAELLSAEQRSPGR
jgi:hypothetical protein